MVGEEARQTPRLQSILDRVIGESAKALEQGYRQVEQAKAAMRGDAEALAELLVELGSAEIGQVVELPTGRMRIYVSHDEHTDTRRLVIERGEAWPGVQPERTVIRIGGESE